MKANTSTTVPSHLGTTITRRKFIFSALALSLTPTLLLAKEPDSYMRELEEGNRRFASGRSKHPHWDRARVHDTGVHGQHPRAVILSCADSRVAPEVLFDQGVGDLFTVRVAGNVANDDEIASVEYAVEHLGVPLCVVLGHSHCGAVKAVVNEAHASHTLEHLLVHIKDSYHRVQKDHPELKGEELVQSVVEQNVRESIRALTHGSQVLNERVSSKSLQLVGAVYDVESGRFHWL